MDPTSFQDHKSTPNKTMNEGTRELYNYREGASGCCLCIRQIMSIPGLTQDHRLHESFCPAISIHKTRCKTTPNSMDHCSSKIRKLTRAEIRDLFHEERLIEISENNNEPWTFMASLHRQGKSARPGFIGHISFAMYVNWSKLAMHVSELETFPQEMKHLKTIELRIQGVERSAFTISDARKHSELHLGGLFARFGIPKAHDRDRGTHFCNIQIEESK
ncbi:hypothetical protein Tco_0634804 [Tanacetum coccineum]